MTSSNFGYNRWEDILSYYFKNTIEGVRLKEFLKEEREKKPYKIYPSNKDIFKAFDICLLNKVKVIIIGQDPYFNGCADGLAFSSKIKTKSLGVIFEEIFRTEGINNRNYKLDNWANQGVLLMNRVLSVIENRPNSHYNKGWEGLTNLIIEVLSDIERYKIFMLWGNKAKEVKPLIKDSIYNEILETSHPAARGEFNKFIGSNIFSDCNKKLKAKGIEEIDWST